MRTPSLLAKPCDKAASHSCLFTRDSGAMLDVETFIRAVKERPALYCPTHKNYNKREMRARLWNEIGQVMYPEWPHLEEKEKRSRAMLMQKKWKSLKDCFNRELRQRKIRDTQKVRKQYEFYDSLSFLLRKKDSDFIQPFHHEIIIKTEDPPDENVNLESPQPLHQLLSDRPRTQQQSPQIRILHNTLQCSNKPVNQPRRQLLQKPPQTLLRPKPANVTVLQETSPVRQLEEDQRKRRSPKEETMRPRQERRPDGADDSDRLFLMSFVSDMKKLPLSTKYWVKMKFSDIMHQATMSLDGVQGEDEEEGEEQETEGLS